LLLNDRGQYYEILNEGNSKSHLEIVQVKELAVTNMETVRTFEVMSDNA
jgi:hypothetical protein